MKKLALISIVALSLLGVAKTNAQVGIGVQISVAPPEIPVYTQPVCPTEGYLWTPGYWAYGTYGYFWVPGVWVSPPTVGYLWTPGYWGFNDGIYAWNGGYWGSNIGFYGGVNYGYGYGGSGYYGGRWEGGSFRYNSAVCNVGSSFHNTYVDRTVIVNNGNHTSFNGKGGLAARPNAAEESAMKENHIKPTSAQQSHEHSASISKNQSAKVNGGHPPIAAKSSVGGQRYNATGHTMATSTHSTHSASASTATHATASQTRAQSSNTHQAAMQSKPAHVQQAPRQQAQAPRSQPQQSHAQQAPRQQAQAPRQQPQQSHAQHAAPAPQHSAPPMQQHQSAAPSHGGGEEKR